MVEMIETANFLRHATAESLVILDEVEAPSKAPSPLAGAGGRRRGEGALPAAPPLRAQL